MRSVADRAGPSPGTATAFAPATVANVAVGFDLLGFPIDGPGDEVTVSIAPGHREVVIREIRWEPTAQPAADLPRDASRNTAAVALRAMRDGLDLSHGFDLTIRKGIALSSGMGGSAASAVAAVVAANHLLRPPHGPLGVDALFQHALAGEAVASGSLHGDNVAPALFGGLNLVLPTQPLRALRIPVPPGVFCALIHPRIQIETRQARALLRPDAPLALSVRQSAWLGGFLAGCYTGDLGLIGVSLRDDLIEPQRSGLIPGFDEMKTRATELGALGFSISGAGPSVFAWAEGRERAAAIRDAVDAVFRKEGIEADGWVSPVSGPGARIVARGSG